MIAAPFRMRLPSPIAFALVLIFGHSALHAAPEVKWPEPTREGLDFFEREVRPVLANACYDCHSASSEKVKGDLLLDTFQGVSKGGTNGAVIVPGDPDKSPLVEAVRGEDKDFMMPPKEKLPDQVRIILERWVKMGAPMPRTEAPAQVAKGEPPSSKMMDVAEAKKRWQFQPVVERPYPKVRNAAWSPHPIDLFLMAKWEQKQLVPALPADKRTLLRRATFDLTGLPPSPKEMSAFLADPSPTAFNRVVDRLLASPAYGERWGRHWLDVVRYADTGGDSADYPVPEAYKYRDYVIDAFNADKPYNAFLKEQLAGDLLPTMNEAQRKERLIATGYLAMSRRFGVAPQMELTIDDTIDNVSKAMLGLTVACARCHDHKFDPISARDYYALYGIFASTKYPFPGSENVKRPSDFVPLVSKEEVEKALAPHKGKLAAFDEDIARIKKERDEAKKAGGEKTPKDFRKMIAEVEKQRTKFTDTLPKFEVAYAVSEAKPKDAPVHIRGDAGKKGEVVPRQFLTVLGGQKLTGEQAKQSGRLQLAEWIIDAKNPLTARVMVNRIWQRHFGKGLVATPNDWGKQWKAPQHPELVDFLAHVFVKNGYSMKNMHRLIMSSKAYQMSSDELPANMAIDGANELLWRFSRQRLDAESIRDSILAVSGSLDRSRPGAHPFPPMEKWGFTQHAAFSAVYTNNHRSVYQMQQRIKKHPFFGLFDGADTNACTAERPLSTTPLQALFMMNDEFIKTQSEVLADRLLKDQPSDPQRVLLAWWLAYQRAPQPDETNDALSFLRQYASKVKATNANAQPADITRQSFAALSRVLFTSNEFLFND
ncbi:MAG: Planctomycete cytochrome [Chthoniobacter sp.]|nr:Planctomycete cytochrome [Chthoniobacter sp.]